MLMTDVSQQVQKRFRVHLGLKIFSGSASSLCDVYFGENKF